MDENLSVDYFTKRLDFINDKNLNKLNEIESNFNKLKDNFYELSKQYENNDNKNEENNDDIISQLNSKMTELLSEERENNINYINSYISEYNIKKSLIDYNEQNDNKKYIENFEEEIKQIIDKINEKIEYIKMEKNNNIQVINIQMSNEINNLLKKINDTSLDLILTNSNKASAIQDIVKIYLNKFKASKNEFNEFEEKITKLISELLDKIVLLKQR